MCLTSARAVVHTPPGKLVVAFFSSRFQEVHVSQRDEDDAESSSTGTALGERVHDSRMKRRIREVKDTNERFRKHAKNSMIDYDAMGGRAGFECTDEFLCR